VYVTKKNIILLISICPTADKEFTWIDGMNWNFTNWAASEPVINGSQMCVYMNTEARDVANNQRWKSANCTFRQGFSCRTEKGQFFLYIKNI